MCYCCSSSHWSLFELTVTLLFLFRLHLFLKSHHAKRSMFGSLIVVTLKNICVYVFVYLQLQHKLRNEIFSSDKSDTMRVGENFTLVFICWLFEFWIGAVKFVTTDPRHQKKYI